MPDYSTKCTKVLFLNEAITDNIDSMLTTESEKENMEKRSSRRTRMKYEKRDE